MMVKKMYNIDYNYYSHNYNYTDFITNMFQNITNFHHQIYIILTNSNDNAE